MNRVLRLQVEAKAIAMAIASCRQERLKAAQQHHATQIADLRSRAAEARAAAAAITSQSMPLLEQLKQIEGVDHTPLGVALSVQAGSRADGLERQAAEMERRGHHRHGHVEIDAVFDLNEIVLAVLQEPVDTPPASDLIAWVESQPRSNAFAGAAITCRLNWDMTLGGIQASSYVRLSISPAAKPVPPGEPASGPRLLDPNVYLGAEAGRRFSTPEQVKTA